MLSTSLETLTEQLGSRSRAHALLRWLWTQPALPAELPHDIPGVSHRVWRPLRAQLRWHPPRVVHRAESRDGTVKYALSLGESVVETVRIPTARRSTICISSQAGCTRRCAFCATQTLGFERNLTADEMLFQYALARAEAPQGAPATNVVFMGMGEPFDNLDAVLQAVRALTQGPLPQLRAQSVTVSTSGVLPGLGRFLEGCSASLALSLNATTDEVRTRLMPHNRTWPIEMLLEALREHARKEPKRQHFFEYVVFGDVNDTPDDADRLVSLLSGIPARLNLIPHNPFPGSPFAPPTHEALMALHARLVAAGVRALVRWPRGDDVQAACGQLARRALEAA